MAGYAFPQEPTDLSPPPTCPTPRFSSPVPGPKIKEKERLLLEQRVLAGLPATGRKKLGNNNKKTKAQREGGKAWNKAVLVVCLELVRTRVSKRSVQGRNGGRGRGRFWTGRLHVSKITLPPTIGKECPKMAATASELGGRTKENR